jgi:hypothetical protein
MSAIIFGSEMLALREIVTQLKAAWPAKYADLGTRVKAGKYQAVIVTPNPNGKTRDVEPVTAYMSHSALVLHLTDELATIRAWVQS